MVAPRQEVEENQIKVIDCFAYAENKILGKGSYGIVYQGYDTKQHLDIAVKKVSLEMMQKQDEKSAEFLRSEIKNMKVSNHKHLVHLYDVRKSPNNLYLIVEYCNGVSLDKYIKDNGGRLSEFESLEITRQVLQGYEALLQKNIIHRDLKPANILLHNGFVKITDFGFSKAVEVMSDDPVAWTRVGSPLFMSPQILKGVKYSVKTDIWSLGVQLFYMLYGKYPFMANDPVQLEKVIRKTPLQFPPKPKVNTKTKEILKKMLVIEENDRISWEELFQIDIFQEISDEEIGQMLKQITSKNANNPVLKIHAHNTLYFSLNRVIKNPFSCQDKVQKSQNIVIEGKQRCQQLLKLFSIKKDLPVVDVGKIKEYREKYNYLNPFFEAQDLKMMQRDAVQEIGIWMLQKRNKAVHIQNIALQFFQLFAVEKKLQIDELAYFSAIFAMSKYSLLQMYRLYRIVNIIKQQHGKQKIQVDEEPKDQRFSDFDVMEETTQTKKILGAFPDEKWKILAQTNDLEFIMIQIRQDLSVCKQFFNEIQNLTLKFIANNQPTGNGLKDRKIKTQLQEISRMCGKDPVDVPILKNLLVGSVTEIIKKVVSGYLNLGDQEATKKQDELIFIQFLLSLTNIKKYIGYQKIVEVDFNKYYESIEKADINELIKATEEINI